MLSGHDAVFHTDAAQGFGKELDGLRSPRLDLISVSAHKIFGPKGVGALIARQNERTARLAPLCFGGGQERGLRPGTVPVPLVAGLGLAAELALRDHSARRAKCLAFRTELLSALAPLQPVIVGDTDRVLPHVVSLRFGDIDSEAVMIALRDEVAISNGSACTSNTYQPSHVLKAMGLSDSDAQAATRWSWCHLTPDPDWRSIERPYKCCCRLSRNNLTVNGHKRHQRTTRTSRDLARHYSRGRSDQGNDRPSAA